MGTGPPEAYRTRAGRTGCAPLRDAMSPSSPTPIDPVLWSPLPADLGDGTPGSPRLVVDILLAVPQPAQWSLLLLKRRPDQGGFWQGVSGRVEAFDAHLEAAARREIREETGYVEGVEIHDLGRWVDFTGPTTGRAFRKRCLGALLPAHAGPGTVQMCDEHLEARLASFDEACSLVAWPGNRDEIRSFEAWLRTRPPRV